VLISYFGAGSIVAQDASPSFADAVSQSVSLLVASGKAQLSYVDEVLESLKTLGPYFVIAPGLALAHAKPSDSVLAPGMALLKLAQPVISGSANDPVSLVFSMCSPNASEHMEMLADFGQIMSTDQVMTNLLNASAVSVIEDILFKKAL
jgi:PTS system ascorbate-specific IIA component